MMQGLHRAQKNDRSIVHLYVLGDYSVWEFDSNYGSCSQAKGFELSSRSFMKLAGFFSAFSCILTTLSTIAAVCVFLRQSLDDL